MCGEGSRENSKVVLQFVVKAAQSLIFHRMMQRPPLYRNEQPRAATSDSEIGD